MIANANTIENITFFLKKKTFCLKIDFKTFSSLVRSFSHLLSQTFWANCKRMNGIKAQLEIRIHSLIKFYKNFSKNLMKTQIGCR